MARVMTTWKSVVMMCRMRWIMLGTEDETFAVTSFAALGRCCTLKSENRKLSEKYVEICAIWCYNIVGDKTCK